MKNGRYHFSGLLLHQVYEKMLIQVYFMLLQLHIKIIFYYSRFYSLIMYKLRSSDEELIFIIAIEWRWKECSVIKPQMRIDHHLLMLRVIQKLMYEEKKALYTSNIRWRWIRGKPKNFFSLCHRLLPKGINCYICRVRMTSFWMRWSYITHSC